MIQTFTLQPGVTLRCFPDARFKQGLLSLQFLRPMCKEEAALNALIPAVLLRGTQSAPDLRTITLKLDDLYGAAVGAGARFRHDNCIAVLIKCGQPLAVGIYGNQ